MKANMKHRNTNYGKLGYEDHLIINLPSLSYMAILCARASTEVKFICTLAVFALEIVLFTYMLRPLYLL